MDDAPARLLVSVPNSPALSERIARALPGIPVEYAGRDSTGPWPEVEAWLVGSPARELPAWRSLLSPRLRFVQRLFTGLDDFPFDSFPSDIAVAGNVGAFAPFVSEHAVALVLALAHDLLANHAQVRGGKLRPPRPNRYLEGRTVLLLGYGEIAQATAERLRPFGPHLEAVTRTGAPAPGIERTHSSGDLAEALARADVVIDCRPLTRTTRATIGRDALARMRTQALFVNVGRAATVDEEALFLHLKTHPEFRAATDVWWQEDFERGTLGSRFPFAQLPNFLGTPHVAGVGAEARARAEERAVANLARFFSGAPPLHLADRTEYTLPATRPAAADQRSSFSGSSAARDSRSRPGAEANR